MMARIGAILAPYIVLLVRKLPLTSYRACIVAWIFISRKFDQIW